MAENASDNVITPSAWQSRGLRGPIDNGPTGPQPPDMDARVAKLEQDMSEVRAALGRIEPLLIRIDERLNHLPSKGFVIGTTIAIVSLVVAAIAAAPYLRVPV